MGLEATDGFRLFCIGNAEVELEAENWSRLSCIGSAGVGLD